MNLPMDLCLHLRILLRNHDCVVLPGVGAFLVHDECARWSDDGCELLPPSRVLGFNSEITHNDGLLASSVAKSMGLACDVAFEQFVVPWAKALSEQLSDERSVTLDGLGTLKLNQEDILEFSPVPNIADGAALAWLQPVRMEPVESPRSGKATIQPIAIPRWRQTTRASLRVAASLALVLTLGLALLRPIDIAKTHEASMTPSATVIIPAQKKSMEAQAARLLIGRVPDNQSMGVEDTLSRNIYRRSMIGGMGLSDFGDGPYYVIVASFPSERLARLHIAQTGIHAQVLHADGRFRVYTARRNSMGAAAALTQKHHGWVLRH